ncbi:glycosyltransferase family 2 protein [Arthrobacter agilis]|jgi:cellulose synthase/poly-beta-1,6-N-acetylglucosamine synthase-like glycosyltransferase|uniref:glycosyltransferase family 2 protein n=1 Tax=Arthrobacter agilis TaxID=37921 RepID=UPI0027891644|nr:glycosyltransferase family 2 protein [Arthrobacter agilis]MDQ0736329.1 cellulose synthase/poly-beta-1,6-N-acetylglucosamine synthase-like glycosyltransferase [Arthrobacter agilis]
MTMTQEAPHRPTPAAAEREVPARRAIGLDRIVGLVIAGIVISAAVLLWLALAAKGPDVTVAESNDAVIGVWHVLYNSDAPEVSTILTAIALALLAAAGLAIIERRIATKARRSMNPGHQPLAPKVIMAATRGGFAGEVTVTVLIPAHNEEASLPQTIASLQSQSHRPERIIVVADNCTDATVQLARAAGVEVIESVGNTKKKAGALNQALRTVLPQQGDNDVVMVMDADTQLDDGFLAHAVVRFVNDRALMAVGGLFYGEDGHGLIGQFQRNEYIRYSRQMRRRRGRVFVLTGTASLFRPVALRTIADSRGRTLPGRPGDVYDTAALTEDNELTIALKSLGGLMISPQDCTVVTELMPSWGTLWNQRLRWQRGALENIGAYGVTAPTMRYWAQQLGIGYGVIALSAYLALIALTIVSLETWIWFPFWLGLGFLFTLERLVTVWKGGWKARLLAVTLFPELFFDMFLNLVYVKGVIDLSSGRQASWKHLTHDTPARTLETQEA